MRPRALLWAAIIGVLAIAVAYVFLTRPPAHPPVPKDAAPAMAISGNYADDWMKTCAPLTADRQKACTAALDAAYGRQEGAPVPPEKAGK